MVVSLRKADLIAVGGCCAALVFLLDHTTTFAPSLLEGYPGDAFFPRLVLGFTLFWGGVIVLRRLFQTTADVPDTDEPFDLDVREFAIILAAVVAYALLLDPVGFEVTTAVLLAGLLIPRYRVEMTLPQAVVWAVGVSLATVLISWLVFVILLNVDMPLLLLPRYIVF